MNRTIGICDKDEEKYLIQTRSTWSKEGVKSKPKARKANAMPKKGITRRAVDRSGDSRIEKMA